MSTPTADTPIPEPTLTPEQLLEVLVDAEVENELDAIQKVVQTAEDNLKLLDEERAAFIGELYRERGRDLPPFLRDMIRWCRSAEIPIVFEWNTKEGWLRYGVGDGYRGRCTLLIPLSEARLPAWVWQRMERLDDLNSKVPSWEVQCSLASTQGLKRLGAVDPEVRESVRRRVLRRLAQSQHASLFEDIIKQEVT